MDHRQQPRERHTARGRPPAGATVRSLGRLLVASCLGVVLSIGLTACGSGGESRVQAESDAMVLPAEAGHVHGIVSTGPGGIAIGTHAGLFTAGPDGNLTRAGDDADYMGLAALRSGALLSSGHPAPGSGEPDPLGLRISRDGGATWGTVNEVPRDDYHVIRTGTNVVYAVGSDGAILAGATPTTMRRVATAPPGLLDLAVHPGRGSTLVAATRDGLLRSRDGGRTWDRRAGVRGLLSWASPDALFLVDANGEVSASDDAGASWSRRGTLGGPPAALLAMSDMVLVAADHGNSIVESRDGGRIWTKAGGAR